jgi:gamma-glutamyltranspeptidase
MRSAVSPSRAPGYTFSRDVTDNLKHIGHTIQMVDLLGDVQAILGDEISQEWSGWNDPRKDGI